MKNVNKEGLNELSQNELTQIEGGRSISDILRDSWDHCKDLLGW